MKAKFLIAGLLAVCTFSGKAQDTITASKAKANVGKQVVLCDRVNYGRYLNMNKTAPVRLYVGPDYPNHYFTLVFPQDVLARFSFDPEKKMINKRFCATGTITMYRKKPAMIIKSESQVNAEE
jgi:hypothetical protein